MCSHWQPGAAADCLASCAVFLVMFTILSSMTSTETANINGETRCYCNEAGCVSTGYMCKSARLGACFSLLSRDKTTVWSTHGCAESLPQDEFGACMQFEEAMNSDDVVDGQPVLICCDVDMCNYMDNVGISVFFSRRDGEQSAAATGSKRVHDSRSDLHSNWTENNSNVPLPSVNDGRIDQDGDDDPTSGSQLVLPSDGGMWLRVAIIAVPVIGVCLLIPLVLIAIRLLTSDRRNASNKHGQLRHWLLAGHVTSAVTGNSAPIVSEHNCSQCRTASVGWCDCDKQIKDDSDLKQSGTSFIPSFPQSAASSHHHFVMAAIHNGSSGRRGYEQIRSQLVHDVANFNRSRASVVSPVRVTSLRGGTVCSQVEHSYLGRSPAFTV